MADLVRIALQAVLFFLLLGAVIGVFSDGPTLLEKAVMAVVGVAVVLLAPRVHHIGARPA
jgi:hypothetical protein